MNTNEPTTGEIVRALRYCVGKDTICGTACPAYSSEAGCRTAIMKNAADRLESQERELYDKSEQLTALTARAESAERERDAAVRDMLFFGKNAHTCKLGKACNMVEIDHSVCIECKMWTWRGQPQEGEGK